MNKEQNYRPLTLAELEELKPQFVRFLAAQGLPADEWERIKNEDAARTEQLVNQFSALVYDDVLSRAEYIEQRSKDRYFCIRCLDDKMLMRGILIEGDNPLDLRTEMPSNEMLKRVREAGAQVKLVAGERAYQHSRANEIYNLLENNHRIAKDDSLYRVFDNMVEQQTKAENKINDEQ